MILAGVQLREVIE
jgi:hypothetical protein